MNPIVFGRVEGEVNPLSDIASGRAHIVARIRGILDYFTRAKSKLPAPQRHIISIGFSFHFLRVAKAAIKSKSSTIFTEEMRKVCPERTAV